MKQLHWSPSNILCQPTKLIIKNCLKFSKIKLLCNLSNRGSTFYEKLLVFFLNVQDVSNIGMPVNTGLLQLNVQLLYLWAALTHNTSNWQLASVQLSSNQENFTFVCNGCVVWVSPSRKKRKMVQGIWTGRDKDSRTQASVYTMIFFSLSLWMFWEGQTCLRPALLSCWRQEAKRHVWGPEHA